MIVIVTGIHRFSVTDVPPLALPGNETQLYPTHPLKTAWKAIFYMTNLGFFVPLGHKTPNSCFVRLCIVDFPKFGWCSPLALNLVGLSYWGGTHSPLPKYFGQHRRKIVLSFPLDITYMFKQNTICQDFSNKEMNAMLVQREHV